MTSALLLRVAPKEPLVLLSIAAGLLNLATTRRVHDRHRAILQAFAFLQEYSSTRGCPQEAAYNTARAAHQLGLLHIAVPYYERALETAPTQPPVASREAVADAGLGGGVVGGTRVPAAALDLQREAAFNLALIYQSSHALPLAREVMRKHLSV
jgi:general transcription factor 3C polypeptide 3 (transcription factor C subunit 4)